MEKIDYNQSVETLARWWNTLNIWEWPKDLPGKPEEFESLKDFYQIGTTERIFNEPSKKKFIDPIMKKIEMLIGRRECLRYHHVNNLGKTDKEFEMWWEQTDKNEYI